MINSVYREEKILYVLKRREKEGLKRHERPAANDSQDGSMTKQPCSDEQPNISYWRNSLEKQTHLRAGPLDDTTIDSLLE